MSVGSLAASRKENVMDWLLGQVGPIALVVGIWLVLQYVMRKAGLPT